MYECIIIYAGKIIMTGKWMLQLHFVTTPYLKRISTGLVASLF